MFVTRGENEVMFVMVEFDGVKCNYGGGLLLSLQKAVQGSYHRRQSVLPLCRQYSQQHQYQQALRSSWHPEYQLSSVQSLHRCLLLRCSSPVDQRPLRRCRLTPLPSPLAVFFTLLIRSYSKSWNTLPAYNAMLPVCIELNLLQSLIYTQKYS